MRKKTVTKGTVPFRKLLTKAVFLVALAATLVLATAGPGKPKYPPCVPLSGTFYFTSLVFGADDNGPMAHGEGIVKDGDVEIATFVADYHLDQRGNGVTQTTASHTITFLDGSGSIVTSDEIRLQDGRASSRLYIIGGTGDYEGATGLVHTHGTIQDGIDFKGQICLP